MIFVWIWEYNIKFQVFTCLQYILFERQKREHIIDFNFLNFNFNIIIKSTVSVIKFGKEKKHITKSKPTPPPKKKIQNKYKTILISDYHINFLFIPFRPQILVLSGYPRNRPALIDFASSITKKQSLLITGHVFTVSTKSKFTDTEYYVYIFGLFFIKKIYQS